MAKFSKEDYSGIISEVYTLFKSKCRPGYIPLFVTGREIVSCLGLTEESDISEIFNGLVYTEGVLELNPETDEVDYLWEDNDYGLCEPYLTRLRRDNGLETLGVQ